MNKRQAMLTWGAKEMECPQCHLQTPVYADTILGGNMSVGCLNCGASLQFKEGNAVLAVYGQATKEEIERAEQGELANMASIAHYKLGIPTRKLSPTLQTFLPKKRSSLLKVLDKLRGRNDAER